MTQEQKKNLFSLLEECSFCSANNNSPKSFALRQDVRTLADRIIHYFDQFYPNLNYKDFYDKPFLDMMKYIIKNQDLFQCFLEYVNYKDDIKDYLCVAVYIHPQVFTSAVNRFIREHYLNDESMQNSEYLGDI